MEYSDEAVIDCPHCGAEITASDVIGSKYYNESKMLFGENQSVKCFECNKALEVTLDAHIVTDMKIVTK